VRPFPSLPFPFFNQFDQWDDRLLTLDPVSLSHIVKNTAVYEKPWQSRTLITSLIGCGMLSAEGQVYKRQRRVVLPSFSGQHMRSLADIAFKKGMQLKDAWMALIPPETDGLSVAKIDVCQFLSRATFDIAGLAGRSSWCPVAILLLMFVFRLRLQLQFH
jgi:cytochrome P450